MGKRSINIEGVQIDAQYLHLLMLQGLIKAKAEAEDPKTRPKRKKQLLSCISQGVEVVNRLNEVNNPIL